MQIIDRCDLGSEGTLYAVELEPGFMVDVKVCRDSGLTYVMQNEDGSTVYDGRRGDYTHPGFVYDEKAVLGLVKEAIQPGMDKIKVAIESTDDYSDATFYARLVEDDVRNEYGTYGRVAESYRIVAINENGRIDKYDDRIFVSVDGAKAAVLADSNLVLVNYDDLVHEAGKGLGAVISDAQVRAAEDGPSKSSSDVDFVKE